MATFSRLEDIQVWQKARKLTRKIYEATSNGRFANDYGLRNQIQRASISIMANIAEGFGRRSDKEFANFLNMAHGSATEVQSHLYVALDLSYISEPTFSELNGLLDEISRMTLVLAQHLRKSKL
ncbi:MAG: four helix bundle protein [Pyrinomonadaceae bacterium]